MKKHHTSNTCKLSFSATFAAALVVAALITPTSQAAEKNNTPPLSPTSSVSPTKTANTESGTSETNISDAPTADEAPQLSRSALFNIIAGEFATYRGQYDQALNYYLQQARFYRSAYLSERATRLAMNQKRYPDMLEAAHIWQTADGSNPLSYFFLSLAQALNENFDQALQIMEQAASLDHHTDFTRLTQLLQSDHDRQSYLFRLIELSDAYPENYDIHLATAILSQVSGKHEQSLAYTDKAIQNADDNESIYYYAARVYLSLNEAQRALNSYHIGVERYPSNTELRLKYAQLATRHDLKLAAQQFEILRRQTPNDPLVLLNLGLINLDQGHIDQAETMFQQLLPMPEHASVANYYLGQIATHRNQPSVALQHLLSIGESPEWNRAREQIADIYIQQQRYSEAETIIDSELERPENTQHQERLNLLKALLLEKQGHPEKAYEHLSRQLSEMPHSVDIRYSRAMLAELQDNMTQMEQDLRHIINQQPDSALALNALGYTLANKTNRLDEAHGLIQQALRLSPEDPAVLDSMGWVLYRMGEWQEALKYLQQAMQQFPDAEVAAHLGEVLWMLGKKDDAKVVFKEALNQTPDHSELNETIKRLNIPL